MARKAATEELLERILHDLDLLINENLKAKDKLSKGGDKPSVGKAKNVNNNNITVNVSGKGSEAVSLLCGMGVIDSSKSNKKDITAMLTSVNELIKADPKKIKAVADSIKTLAEGLCEIKVSKNAAEGMKSMSLFLDAINNLNVKSLFKLAILPLFLNSFVAKRISSFLKHFDMRKHKGVAEGLKGFMTIVQVMEILSKMKYKKGVKAVNLMAKELSLGKGINISAFLSGMVSFMPDNKKDLKIFTEQITAVGDSLNVFGKKVNPLIATSIWIASKLLTEKVGKGLVKFIDALVKPLSKYDTKKLDAASKVISAVGSMILKISIAIGILVLLLAMTDVKTVLIGAGIVVGIIVTLLGLATLISFIPGKRLTKGLDGLSHVAKAAMWASISIGIIALLSKLFGLETVQQASLIVVGIISTLLGMARLVASDSEKTLPQGIEGLEHLSKSAMWASISIGIIALLLKIFDIQTVLIGTGIVIAVIFALALAARWISGEKGELKEGVKGLKTLAWAMLIITICIGLMAYLVDTYDTKTILIGAGIVVGVIMILGIGLWALAKWSKSGMLKEAGTAMLLMAIVLAIVSAVTYFFLIPIGQSWKDAAIGGLVAVAIVGILALIVGILAKQDGKALMYAAGALGIMTLILLGVALITKFLLIPIGEEWAPAAVGALVTVGIIAILAFIVYKLAEQDSKQLVYAVAVLAGMTLILLGVALITKFLLIPIGEMWLPAAAGAIVTLGIIAVLGFIAYKMLDWVKGGGKDEDGKKREPIEWKDMAKAGAILGFMVLTLWAVAAITKEYLVPIGAAGFDGWNGAMVALGIIIALGWIGYKMCEWVQGGGTDREGNKKGPLEWKDLAKAGAILEGMVLILWQVAAITKEYLVPIGAHGLDGWNGALITEEIIVAIGYIGIKACELTQKLNWKDLAKAGTILEGMIAILWQVAVITEKYLIPIGAHGTDGWNGALITEEIIVVLAAIGLGACKIAANISLKDMGKAGLILGAMIAVLAIVADITKDFLIPIGAQAEQALKGAGIVALLIAGMTAIVVAIGLLMKIPSMETIMLEGAAVVAGVGVLFGILGTMMPPFIDLCITTGENGQTVVDGALIIAALVGGMIAVVTVIGTLITVTGGIAGIILTVGAAVVAGVGLVFKALGETMPPFIELCILTGKNDKAVEKGAKIIAPMVDRVTLLCGAIGALCLIPFMSFGFEKAVNLLKGVGEVFGTLGENMPSYIELCIMAGAKEKEVKKGDKLVVYLVDGMSKLAEKVGDMCGFLFGSDLEDGIDLLRKMAPMIREISVAIREYSKAAILLAKVDMNKAKPEVMGKLIDGWANMAKKVGKAQGDDVFKVGLLEGAMVMRYLAGFMTGLSSTMDDFVTVLESFNKVDINKAQQLTKWISGKNGFVDSLMNIVNALDELSIWTVWKIEIIAEGIQPVFEMLKNFMDIIQLYAEMKYPTKWNEQGQAIEWEKMTDTMFISAAMSISYSFRFFLEQLEKGFEGFDLYTVLIINLMKDSIAPIMEGVKAFMDTCITVASAQVPCAWDENGNPTDFIPLSDAEIMMAAITICTSFGIFMDTLAPHMEKVKFKAAHVIATMGQGLNGVMQAVGHYVDAVLMFVKGYETEEEVNGKTKKVRNAITPKDFQDAGKTIADSFVAFVDALMVFNDDKYTSQEYVDTKQVIKGEEHWYGDDADKVETVSKQVSIAGGKIKQVMDALNMVMSLIKECTPMVEGIIGMIEKINKAGIKVAEFPNEARNLANSLVAFLAATFNAFKDVSEEACKNSVKKYTELKKIPNLLKPMTDTLINIGKGLDNFNTGMEMIKTFATTFSDQQLATNYTTSLSNIKDIIAPVFNKFAEVMQFFSDGKFILNGEKQSFNHQVAYTNATNVIQILNEFTKAVQSYVQIQNVSITTNVVSTLASSLTKAFVDIQTKYVSFDKQFRNVTNTLKKTIEDRYAPTIMIASKAQKEMYTTLVNLDKELINKDKARNKALEELAKSMQTVSEKVGNVVTELNKLANSESALGTIETRINTLKTSAQELQNTLDAAGNNTNNTSSTTLTAQDIKDALDSMELRKSANGYTFEPA